MSGKMTEMRREDVLERFLLVDFGRMVGSNTWWEDDALWILKSGWKGCKTSDGQAGRKGVGLLKIVGPVWKEWWREMLAGWRRKECAGGRGEALGSVKK